MRTVFFFLGFLVFASCSRLSIDPPNEDCETEISYSNEIKEILDNTCAYSGCHVGGGAPGDYSSYTGLQGSIDNGELRKRMLELKNMPPEYAPDDKPKSLTDDQLDLISCWVQNEYAE